MEWYLPITVLPALGLLILSTSNFIIASNEEIQALEMEMETNIRIIQQKVKQLTRLGAAISLLYTSALLFMVSARALIFLFSTNMYTGLWDAKVDRAPILALTGQVATQVVGTGNFQEVDLVRAYQTVAALEFNQRVEHQSQHVELMNLAIKHAILKRDVSHLTFPDQVQNLAANGAAAQGPEGRMPVLTIAPPRQELEKALVLIEKARRPVIIVGHGARFNMPAITKLAEKLHCAVMTTFKGKGLIADDHRLGCGVLGRSGTPNCVLLHE
jgi:thiamine pyrophosphate-dependent acetolactate synthase large subunit-like protein